MLGKWRFNLVVSQRSHGRLVVPSERRIVSKLEAENCLVEHNQQISEQKYRKLRIFEWWLNIVMSATRSFISKNNHRPDREQNW